MATGLMPTPEMPYPEFVDESAVRQRLETDMWLRQFGFACPEGSIAKSDIIELQARIDFMQSRLADIEMAESVSFVEVKQAKVDQSSCSENPENRGFAS